MGRAAGVGLTLILAVAGCKKDPVVQAAAAPAVADPSTPEGWLALAESRLKARDFEAAEAAAAKAEAQGAKQGAALRAFALIQRFQFDAARVVAEAALQKDPEDLRALAALADAQLELGRLDESSKAVQKMTDLKPNLPSYARASWLRWLQGDVVGAKQIALSALDAGRDKREADARAWSLSQAAGYFWHEGDYDGAEAGYDQALALIPAYPPALVGKARCALSKGDAARALPLVNQAFAQQPVAESGILRAQVMDALKDPGAAVAWKEAEAAGRKDDGFGAGLVLALRGERLDEARTLLQQVRNARPGPYVLDAHALALWRSGRLDEAEEAALGANRHGTKDARLWFHLGAIQLARGKAEGRTLIEKALKLNPAWDPAEVAEAKKLLGG